MASQVPATSPADTLSAAGLVHPLERLSTLLGAQHARISLTRVGGRAIQVSPSHILVAGIERRVQLGSTVEIDTGGGYAIGEVIGVQARSVTIKLFSNSQRLGLGDRVWIRPDISIRPTASWRGRVVNALGEPIDQHGPLAQGPSAYVVDRDPIPPMKLSRVHRPIETGVRAIDLFTPICAGQRIGIFAGSGVGKSTLVSMLSRSRGFKTIVVALVAERGREVREFIEDVLGPRLDRAVVVVASSAESAMMRRLAAKTAMTVAEHFRDSGEDVLLVVDSITRFAHALREIALAAGEPPVARGYAPSVFAELPQLLERAGPGLPGSGSITGLFSVLVDGEDHNEPVADAVRGVLDGHIVLDRTIADQGRYPAINPLSSISRLAHMAWTREEAELVRRLRAMIARFEETRDLRAIGAYRAGLDPELDQAVLLTPMLYEHLTQQRDDPPSAGAFGQLGALLADVRNRAASRDPTGAIEVTN